MIEAWIVGQKAGDGGDHPFTVGAFDHQDAGAGGVWLFGVWAIGHVVDPGVAPQTGAETAALAKLKPAGRAPLFFGPARC